MAEALERLVDGSGAYTDLEIIRKRTEYVTDSNRCFLPVGASLVVRSFLDEFAEDFERHVGRPSQAEPVPEPKIWHIDEDDGRVTYYADRD